jgi:hypothetical protein
MQASTRVRAFGSALVVASLAQSAAPPALAALGGDAASVQADGLHMKGEVRISTAPDGYAIHAIQIPSGTLVREYVSADGKVFAVSWRGPSIPDLRQTLGTYFPQYVAASSLPHGGHHHLDISQPDLVAHSSGNMRAYFGFAYVPGLLPPNFSVATIR